jgi:hypothetical protein
MPHWSVPFDPNPHFVGHSLQLVQLEAKLAPTNLVKKVTVVKLDGISKTQIVLELAYQTMDQFPGHSAQLQNGTQGIHQHWPAAGRALL